VTTTPDDLLRTTNGHAGSRRPDAKDRETLVSQLPFLVKAIAACAAVVLLGAWPFHAWHGAEGLAALGLGVLVVVAGALLGRAARALVPARVPDRAVVQAMTGLGARLLSTAAIAFAVFALDVAPLVPLGASIVTTYFLLLVVEVLDAVRALEPHAERTTGEGAGAR
jgi:hypothetical protein